MIFKEYKLVITRYVAYKKLFLSHLLLLAPATSTTTVSTAPASIATAAASPVEKQLLIILETYKCEQLSRLIKLACPCLRILHGSHHDHRLELRPPCLKDQGRQMGKLNITCKFGFKMKIL